MKYKENWEQTKNNFIKWWNHSSPGSPLMRIVVEREEPKEKLEEVKTPENAQEKHLGVEYNSARLRNYCRTHDFLADSYPSMDLNIGPGSLAVYLGSEPVISEDTIWYEHIVEES